MEGMPTCPSLERPVNEATSQVEESPGRPVPGIELGLGPWHFWTGRGTIVWHGPKHGTARNILDCTGTTGTRGPCRA